MDNETVMKKDKIDELSGILRRSLMIAAKNPKLLLFTLLTSFPLFFFTLLTSFPLFFCILVFEFLFHQTLLSSVDTLLSDEAPGLTFCHGNICSVPIPSYWRWDGSFESMITEHCSRFVLLGFVYLILVHPLDLLNTILIICHSSALYAEQSLQSGLYKSLKLPKIIVFKRLKLKIINITQNHTIYYNL
ncbi:hypothetical protein SAY86_002700 [Trapa natans]|uniref:Uncharacterized protein n=1 Tax=Trapa natans TaxID=22666 RepID=A0AAN7LGE0_TRANT|nr:hypothetical protein SAY86_002700 [Trapa natans]